MISRRSSNYHIVWCLEMSHETNWVVYLLVNFYFKCAIKDEQNICQSRINSGTENLFRTSLFLDCDEKTAMFGKITCSFIRSLSNFIPKIQLISLNLIIFQTQISF